MELGQLVRWRGRRCYVRGYSRLSSAERQYVYLEDARTAEYFTVPIEEIEPEPLHEAEEPPGDSP